MENFDKLWDYNNPAETELKFNDILSTFAQEENSCYRLQLLTQIARTQGLQRRFDEAHKTLDEVGALLKEEQGIEHIRYFLERGRAFNSSGDKRNAEVCFRTALDTAQKLGEDFYAIDAMHMIAIIATPPEAIVLNEQAVLMAEESGEERAKNWLGSLYNNLAWGYFDNAEHEKALSVFLRALKWREDKQQVRETAIAKWCVARTLRALNRIDDAIKVQLGLFEEGVNAGRSDGYVNEELGELFLLKNDKLKSTFHFEKAYELLSTDPYLAQNERPRLERMKKLSR